MAKKSRERIDFRALGAILEAMGPPGIGSSGAGKAVARRTAMRSSGWGRVRGAWAFALIMCVGCAGARVPRVANSALEAPPPRILVEPRGEGTVVTLQATRVTACPAPESTKVCQRSPVVALELRLAAPGARNALATMRTDEVGAASVDLQSVDGEFLEGPPAYDVLAHGRVVASLDLATTQDAMKTAADARKVEEHLARARQAGEREDWLTVQKSARWCLQLERLNTECGALERRATELLDVERAAADARRRERIVSESLVEAKAASRARRWADAARAAQACLDADSEQGECSRLLKAARPRMARELQQSAEAELQAGQILKAIELARACTAAVPGAVGCQAVLDGIEDRYGRAQRVRDFAVYREGGGYVVYFNVITADGEVVRLPGKAELLIYARSYRSGAPVTGWRLRWPVRPKSYKDTMLGLGAFRRGATVSTQWIKSSAFFSSAPVGEWQGKRLLEEYDARVSLVFTDVFGRSFEAETDFVP